MARKLEEILVLATIAIAFLLLSLRIYVVPPILAEETALGFVWLVIIVLSVVAFYIGKRSVLFGAGLFVLILAFFLSLLATVGTIGEEWRVASIVERNPNSYIEWIKDCLIYGIVPIATGITLCIIGYIQRKTLRGRFENLLLLITGGFLVIWGIHYFQVACRDYSRVLSSTNEWDISHISNAIQAIYLAYECVGILWLVTGAFLIVTSFYTLFKQNLAKS